VYSPELITPSAVHVAVGRIVVSDGCSEGVSGVDNGSVGADGDAGDICGEEQAAANIAAGISKTQTIRSNPGNPPKCTQLSFISSSLIFYF
jgi:hypothetical protein